MLVLCAFWQSDIHHGMMQFLYPVLPGSAYMHYAGDVGDNKPSFVI